MKKLTPYAKVLTFAKEKIQEALAPIRANEMKKKAELEMAKLEGKMIELEQKVQEVCADYPINYDKLIGHLDEIGLLERRHKQFKSIVAEMFP